MNLLLYRTVGFFIKPIVTSLTEMIGSLVRAWRLRKTDIIAIPVVEFQVYQLWSLKGGVQNKKKIFFC